MTATRRSGELTRQRILRAAIDEFAQNSYEATTLRGIAARVGVDVALVHRHFGSKELLFAQALRAAGTPTAILTHTVASLPHVLGLKAVDDPGAERGDLLALVAHSLSSPQARQSLRDYVLQDLMMPLAERLGGRTQQAALILACLTGIDIFRNVLAIEALGPDHRGECLALIEAFLQPLVAGAPPPPALCQMEA